MHRTNEQTEQPTADTPAWAQRLAQRCTAHDAAHETKTEEIDWTPNAVSALWAIIDQAVDQANAALKRSGAAERILVHRSTRQYWLSMAGTDGGERQVAVSVSLTQVNGRPSGGALITTNQTRATMWLIASWSGRHLRWVISATGTEFTGRVLGDLFLSIFGYDPAATSRLSSYFTLPTG